MVSSTPLRRALQSTLVPFLRERKFRYDRRNGPQVLDFRRVQDRQLQFLEIQWEPHDRPRFKLSFGCTSAAGVICHGEYVAATEIGPGQAGAYVCLYPRGDGSSTRHWFRQDRPLLSALLHRQRMAPPQEVVQDVIRLYPEVESYFDQRELGLHCHLHLNPWVQELA
jgi:hypothetical protein